VSSHWILKTDADTYPFEKLEREGRTVWDGITSPAGLKNLRSMARGDELLIYHSGKDKAIVGRARVVAGPRPDPKKKDPRLVVVDIEAGTRLPKPVSLAEIKGRPEFADLGLVRMSRLSVIPVSLHHWRRLLAMAGAPVAD
jgi:predicted RNA-binding protein with PUA-like domain